MKQIVLLMLVVLCTGIVSAEVIFYDDLNSSTAGSWFNSRLTSYSGSQNWFTPGPALGDEFGSLASGGWMSCSDIQHVDGTSGTLVLEPGVYTYSMKVGKAGNADFPTDDFYWGMRLGDYNTLTTELAKYVTSSSQVVPADDVWVTWTKTYKFDQDAVDSLEALAIRGTNLDFVILPFSSGTLLVDGLLTVELGTSRAHTPTPTGTFVDSNTISSVSWLSPDEPNDDPNMTVTGYDVYWSDTDPNFVGVSPVSTNQPEKSYTPAEITFGTTYYWRVDTYVTWDSNEITGNYNDILEGYGWQFTTLGANPIITSYENVVTAMPLLAAELSATVSDGDNNLSIAVFEVLEDDFEYPTGATYTLTPDISDLADPKAAFTPSLPGTYKIKLTVTDGEAQVDEALASVVVFESACEAQKDDLSDVWVRNQFDVAPAGGDCIVNLLDFAEFALAWLAESSMQDQENYTGETVYIPSMTNDLVLGTIHDEGTADSWGCNMVIDLASAYTNTSGLAQTLTIEDFAFVAGADHALVTPFVAQWVGDPNFVDPNENSAQFTVVAIGDTLTATDDYDTGYNAVAFSAAPAQITVEAGETIVFGFTDNDAAGSAKTEGSVINYTPVPAGQVNKVWYSGGATTDDGLGGSDSGSVAVDSTVTAGDSGGIIMDGRLYAIQIGFSVD